MAKLRDRIIIFGASKAGILAFRRLKRRFKIIAFADNNIALHGTSLLNVPVISPSSITSQNFQRVMIASMYHREIKQQLLEQICIEPSRVEVVSSLVDYRPMYQRIFDELKPKFLKHRVALRDTANRRAWLAASYYEGREIQAGWILYESYNGREFSCNPRAILQYLLEHQVTYPFDHYIAINDINHPSVQKFRNHPAVTVVTLDSDDYIRVVQTAKYHINNCSLRPYVIKSAEQVLVTSWHGSLMKKLANDTRNYWEGKNVGRTMLAADYFISPNPFSTEKFLAAYGISDLFRGTITHSGYPRNDELFNVDREDIKRKLGVPGNKKIILYAPTWRGQFESKNTVHVTLQNKAEIERGVPDDYVVLVKFHSMVYPFLKSPLDNAIVPLSFTPAQILACTDLLISDFSGIIFDYAVLGRPFLVFAPDYEDYITEKSGLYFAPSKLGVPICKTVSELHHALRQALESDGDYEQSEFLQKMVEFDNGKATERAVQLIFNRKQPEVGEVVALEPQKPTMLLYVGNMAGNGVTSSALALSRLLDYVRYNIVFYISGADSNRDLQRLFDPRACFIYTNGHVGRLLSEFKVLETFNAKGVVTHYGIIQNFVKRERIRLFGKMKFDYVVNFHGYQPVMALFLGLVDDHAKRSIFIHNNHMRDYQIKNKFLLSTFRSYEYYHSLVCVSEGSLDVNRELLVPFVRRHHGFNIEAKLTFTNNTIDAATIRARAQTQISECRDYKNLLLPSEYLVSFVLVGRLSPEKGHLRMLQALKNLLNAGYSAELYIVGDGHYRESIVREVKRLALAEVVHLVGFLENPLPLLIRADCLVLPSDIEGQPIVILEAFVLGVPVIGSDIPGTRDLINGHYGILTPTTVEGLTAELIKFIEQRDRLQTPPLDDQDYNFNAMLTLYQAIKRGCADDNI